MTAISLFSGCLWPPAARPASGRRIPLVVPGKQCRSIPLAGRAGSGKTARTGPGESGHRGDRLVPMPGLAKSGHRSVRLRPRLRWPRSKGGPVEAVPGKLPAQPALERSSEFVGALRECRETELAGLVAGEDPEPCHAR